GVGARQRADDRPLDLLGDRPHALEVALAGDGEAGLDHVDAQARQGVRDLELLPGVQGHARALLAVAQRRVEEPDVPHALTSSAFGPPSASSWRPMNGIIRRSSAPTRAICDSAESRRPVFSTSWPASLSRRNSRAKAPERMFARTSRIAARVSSVTIFRPVT